VDWIFLRYDADEFIMGSKEEQYDTWKAGARVLGIAESFSKQDSTSTVVGIVMRGDLRIDGFGLCHPTVGGLDSTDEIISMYEELKRPDIRALLLGGTIISWFNIVDLQELYDAVGIPVISVTYEETEGIEKYIREYFPHDHEVRMEMVKKGGERKEVSLDNNQSVFVNLVGMNIRKCKDVLNTFVIEGRVPEPIRVSRLIAGVLRKRFYPT
jgi:uncharacterized protein